MAPVVAALTLALAAVGSVEAKPLTPGRHAPPSIANMLSSSKRSLHAIYARYYGSTHGLSKPPALPNKRDVTIPAGWSYHGCITESWDERLLQGFSFYSPVLSPLTCLTECQKRGFDIAGMEYADECYCGNDYVGAGGAPNPDSECNMPCSGDETVMCGSDWRLSLYTYNMTGLPTCVSDSSTNSTTVIVVPTATGSLNETTATATGSATATSSVMPSLNSTELAANATSTANVSVSATSATVTSAQATSTLPVYDNANDQSEWYILGCAADVQGNRLLTDYSETYVQNLTIDGCLSLCEEKGYTIGGLEYGEECYCGNTLPSDITYTPESCNMPCSGDSSETCGGDWSIELYELASAACDNTTSTAIASSTGAATASVSASSVVATSAAATSAAATSAAAASSVVASTTSSAPASSTSVPVSSDTHYVWAHHMVGNTYPYSQSNWASDISKASAQGIDGFALNMGSDWWQMSRIADAYAAAEASGTDFKLFLSLDMTVLSCGSQADATTLVNYVKTFASHPNQAMMNGKVLVSTFAGSDCQFGSGSMDGWATLFKDVLTADGVDIFFVPSIFTDPSTFSSIDWMDGELNWNSAWPLGDWDISTATDSSYMAGLGSDKEYMAAVSPFFFTHFGANSWNKNWLYRSDNWLYATRWEEIIAQRANIKSLEILTWNDYGESSYIGPIEGALPASSDVWVNGFDHEGLSVLTKYYSTAFKTGSYPAIETDTIVMWQRPHPHTAVASGDSAGIPTGWNWTEDYLYAVVLTTDAATVTLTSGSHTETFTVGAGLTKLKVASSVGAMSGSIVRSGSTVASYTSSGSVYTDSPATYNFNYHVGSSS